MVRHHGLGLPDGRRVVLWAIVITVLLAGTACASSVVIHVVNDSAGSHVLTAVRYTSEEIIAFDEAIRMAPEYVPSDPAATLPSCVNRLPDVPYIPDERDQGYVGNCWVWASTGAVEVAHTVKSGVKERLSIEYLDSLYHGGQGPEWAGTGGEIIDFVNFYTNMTSYGGRLTMVPWTNTHAEYQDGVEWCARNNMSWVTHKGWQVSTTPSYPMKSMGYERINTSKTRDQVISSIKNALKEGKTPVFEFYLPSTDAEDAFYDFWGHQDENAVWDMGRYQGQPYLREWGHGVLCVGYDDSSRTWIMLNSWGTTAQRPNGLFRIGMDFDYQGYYTTPSKNIMTSYWNLVTPVFWDEQQVFTEVMAFGAPGMGDGQMNRPFGIDLDPDRDRIFLADTWNQRVQVFDLDGGYRNSWGSQGMTDGTFQFPTGIASLAPDNRLYVAEENPPTRLQVFSDQGGFLSKWGSTGSGTGQFSEPRAVAVDQRTGRVFVADTNNHRIQVFEKNGTYIRSIGTSGGSPQTLSYPFGVAIDPVTGSVFVSDAGNYRITEYTENGTFRGAFGTRGTGYGQFAWTAGLTVDPYGRVFVIDEGNNLTQVFTTRGEFLASWGSKGSVPGQFHYPLDVSFNPENGYVYISDSLNNRVQVFAPVNRSFSPTCLSITPQMVTAGAPGLNLTVNGAGFLPSGIIRVNSHDVLTIYESTTRCYGLIPASDLLFPGHAEITVHNGLPGGGTSYERTLAILSPTPTVTPTKPTPTITKTPTIPPTLTPTPTRTPPITTPPTPKPPNVLAQFTMEPAGPFTVQFNETSKGEITSWFWRFGDGSSSTRKNPVHEYPFPGVYTVELFVKGPFGSASMEKQIFL